MNRFKVNAFFGEFPWLFSLLEEMGYVTLVEENSSAVNAPRKVEWALLDAVEEVKVKRIDKDFLEKTPTYEGATGSLVGIANAERILLLDGDGNLLEEPNQARKVTHNEAYQDDEDEVGETVGEALLHLENPNSVMYALCVHTGYRIHNHHSIGGFSVTVYKPPRGFSLKEWVEEQKKRAEQMLAAEIAQIDAEAQK